MGEKRGRITKPISSREKMENEVIFHLFGDESTWSDSLQGRKLVRCFVDFVVNYNGL